jgi:hypothetical protein
MPDKKKRDETHTPLGREYARLNAPTTDDPGLDVLSGSRSYRAEELAIWNASVGAPKLPLGPDAIRPNPVVVGGLVICSTFSPGSIIGFDRETGKRRWSLRLAYYGQCPYCPRGTSLLFGGTSKELLAIRPATGKFAWKFSPYGQKGETLYSLPTLNDGQLFIGDRYGHLHCLGAETGEPVWKVLTSRAANNDVNSTPVVCDGFVAVGTNARLALGYNTVSGQTVWRHRLDGPCTRSVVAGEKTALFWTHRSAYLINIADGTLLGRWGRRYQHVDCASVAGDITLMVTRHVWGANRLPWPTSQLRAYRSKKELYALSYPRWAGVSIRYETTTGRVYEATSYGLGILDPVSGLRKAVVTDFGGDDFVESGHVHQPWVECGRLYVLNGRGNIFALKHP